MEIPVTITFRGIDPSPFLEARVRERAARLQRFRERITSCDVTLEAPHQRHNKGNLFAIRLRVATPIGKFFVNQASAADHSHEDFYVALRDVFDIAERKLDEAPRARSERQRAHAVPSHGRVVRLFLHDGYGFIETSDELEVYFHENSVVGGRFADLAVGDEVRLELAPDESEKGPQASTVRPIGKHHLVG